MSRRGLVIVYTGNGKGKTTAALGMAFRAYGYGFKSLMIQFVKGSWKSGEHTAMERLMPEFEIRAAGKGFVGIGDDTLPFEEHQRAAAEALEEVRQIIQKGAYDIILLDEIFVALTTGLITEEQVLALIDTRPGPLHLVMTGRGCPQSAIDRADIVTEMNEIKHVFQTGQPAEIGVDF